MATFCSLISLIRRHFAVKASLIFMGCTAGTCAARAVRRERCAAVLVPCTGNQHQLPRCKALDQLTMFDV